MKTRSLSVLAGLGTLILAPSASAGFLGIDVVSKDTGDQSNWGDPSLRLFVCNIYATFDTRDGDLIFAVAGIAGSRLSVRVQNGKFYQHEFGSDRAPNPAFFPEFPSLEFDTFVSIGKKTSGFGDETSLSPGWPGFGNSELGGAQDLNRDGTPDGDNIAWFLSPDVPPRNQGLPNTNNQVLLGQYVADLNSGATGIEGEFLLAGDSNDVGFQEFVSFKHSIPAPGALALFGAAGLIGRRRRR